MHFCTVLLGSNVPDATDLIDAVSVQLLEKLMKDSKCSDILKSADQSQGVPPDAPLYSNRIIQGRTNHTRTFLESQLKAIEDQFGRRRDPEANGWVAMDLDLVEWDGLLLRPKDASRSYFIECMKSLQSNP